MHAESPVGLGPCGVSAQVPIGPPLWLCQASNHKLGPAPWSRGHGRRRVIMACDSSGPLCDSDANSTGPGGVSAQGPAICRHLPPAVALPGVRNHSPWEPLPGTGAACFCSLCGWERRRPELYGRPGPEQAGPWVRTCCQDGWLARGWFCRWCGRDQFWGGQGILRGIYGAVLHSPMLCRKYCVCGNQLPIFDWKYISCRSCYWVLTRQLVRHLLEQFGPWSHIHDSIFIFFD